MSSGLSRALFGVLTLGLLLQVIGCAHGSSTAVARRHRASPSAGALVTPPQVSSLPMQRKPNVLLLMVDDEALGDMWAMPRTRRLIGRHGVTFRRAFSSYPLCCPARTTVLTGQEAHNHGVMGNQAPWGGFTEFRGDDETLPVWLSRAGYRTSLVGKYLNAYPAPGHETYVPPGWSNWLVPVHNVYDYVDQVVNENGVLRAHHEYQTDWVTSHVDDAIRAGARSNQPFFVWASFLAPHFGTPIESDDPRALNPAATATAAVAGRYRDHFSHLPLPHPPSLNEKDLSDKSPFMSRAEGHPVGELREAYQQRLEALLSVDHAVAEIVRTLRETGQLEDTYVFFVSDNGFLVGQHRRYMKVLGYEESIRIPMLLRGPGVPAGASVRQQVSLADLSATISAVTGATPTRTPDGVSLLRMIGHPAYLRDRPMLLEAGGWPFPRRKRLYVGVRTAANRVLLKWFDGTIEVYDLATDPYELDGRISGKERRWVGPMRRELRIMKNCAGISCRDPK